jgi:hypothetical protein
MTTEPPVEASDAPTERVLGDVATNVVLDNDHVRIWTMTLEPGERSAIHRHEHDYILVFLEGDCIGVEPEPDSAGEYRGKPLNFPPPIGQAVYVRKGGVETAVNCGTARYHELLIELKDT